MVFFASQKCQMKAFLTSNLGSLCNKGITLCFPRVKLPTSICRNISQKKKKASNRDKETFLGALGVISYLFLQLLTPAHRQQVWIWAALAKQLPSPCPLIHPGHDVWRPGALRSAAPCKKDPKLARLLDNNLEANKWKTACDLLIHRSYHEYLKIYWNNDVRKLCMWIDT